MQEGYSKPKSMWRTIEYPISEDLIRNTFYNKHDTDILVLFPKLKKYDGINALKQIVGNYQIPSETSILISYLWSCVKI